MTKTPDLIVVSAAVFTADPAGTAAEAFAVADGEFTAVGSSAEVSRLAGPDTTVLDAGGRMVMPGICDVHTHLSLGGALVAWDLPIAPHFGPEEICEAVAARAARLGPEEWIVGGVIGSTTMDGLADVGLLAVLDRASAGRPVLLRDDTQHNRWVNSAALRAMGVTEDSPDPEGGTYVRDGRGRLTGVLWEQASRIAEEAFAASVEDPDARHRVSFATAAQVCNRHGITTVCDAATMEAALRTLTAMEAEGELTLRVVTSTVARPLLAEAGISGKELLAVSGQFGSELLHVGFVKVFLDGVPMTRTAAMLDPYLPHGCSDHGSDSGECLYDLDELVEELETAVSAGRGVKIHAAGDASTRMALDAIAVIRERHGSRPMFHLAHTEYVTPSDIRRFGELGVVADASPYLWYPGIIQDSLAACVPAEVIERAWPLADLLAAGANVSAGSDWPAGAPTPHTWTGIETMVTRQAPGGSEETVNPAQRLTLHEALVSFTRRPAEALGLGERVGSIEVGKSADFLVLSQNLFEVDARRIHETDVLATYLRGSRVHAAGA
ncbi:amidohydrolase [Kitasatospora sp. NPDC056651]|uniref:amidohydrolase n=1 Tax=Kitasatospora sp. NPDC056651 TaxID=3345892 RepID=UPI0036997B1D